LTFKVISYIAHFYNFSVSENIGLILARSRMRRYVAISLKVVIELKNCTSPQTEQTRMLNKL